MQIHAGADQKTVKAAYHTLMFKHRCHPDLGGSEDQAQLINEAYSTLVDSEKRQNYNKTLGSEAFDKQINSSDFVERRRVPRVEIDFTALYKLENGEYQSARILDLSYLGCRIQTQNLVGNGERVTINIEGHLASGVVRWKRMFHPSVFQRIYEAGVEFDAEFSDLDAIKIRS